MCYTIERPTVYIGPLVSLQYIHMAFPPLSACTYVTIITLFYGSVLFGNLVTLRQVELSKKSPVVPLSDTLILQDVELPSFTDRLLLRDWVDAIAGVWCTLCFTVWFFNRRRKTYTSFTTFLMSETVIIPLFCVSQWMTSIPDSDPTCLDTVELPNGTDWVWSRISLNQCGDMLWSSAVAQSILFAYLVYCTISRPCVAYIWTFLSTTSILCISVMAWVARYQYSCDILLTLFVVPLVCTHPTTKAYGRTFFHMNWDRQFPSEPSEQEGLMTKRHDEEDDEFGIEMPSD